MKLCASVFGLCFFIQTASANDLLLFGGSNHDEFLGCLVCNEYKC